MYIVCAHDSFRWQYICPFICDMFNVFSVQQENDWTETEHAQTDKSQVISHPTYSLFTLLLFLLPG